MYLVQEYGTSGNVFTTPTRVTTPTAVTAGNDESFQSRLQSDRLLVVQLKQSKQAIEEMLKCLEKRIMQLQISVPEIHTTKPEVISEINSNKPIVSSISVRCKDPDVEKKSGNSEESDCTNGNRSILSLPQRNPKAIRNQQSRHQDVSVITSSAPNNLLNTKTQSTAMLPVVPISAPNRTNTIKDISQPESRAQAGAGFDVRTSTASLTNSQAFSEPLQSFVYTKAQLESPSPKAQINIPISSETVRKVSQQKPSPQRMFVSNAPISAASSIESRTMSVPLVSSVHTTTRLPSGSSNTQTIPKDKKTRASSKQNSHTKAPTTSGMPALAITTIPSQVPPEAEHLATKKSHPDPMSSQIQMSVPKSTEAVGDASQSKISVQASAALGFTSVPVRKSYYPPIIVEILPNRLYHIKQLKTRLGKEFKVRTYGKTVKFLPEKGYENRVVKSYLTDLQKTDNILWFICPTSTV